MEKRAGQEACAWSRIAVVTRRSSQACDEHMPVRESEDNKVVQEGKGSGCERRSLSLAGATTAG